jgi:hypothetical protein
VDGEDCTRMSSITCTLQEYYWGVQVNENEMGGACSSHGKAKKCVHNFGPKT